jgi:hypothetical protein
VIPHNGSKFPPVHLAHAAELKESNENMELPLGKIDYEKYNWKIYGHL